MQVQVARWGNSLGLRFRNTLRSAPDCARASGSRSRLKATGSLLLAHGHAISSLIC